MASSVPSLAIHDSLDKFQTLNIVYKTFPTLVPCLPILLPFFLVILSFAHSILGHMSLLIFLEYNTFFAITEPLHMLFLLLGMAFHQLFTWFTSSHSADSLQRLLLLRGFLDLSKSGGLYFPCYVFSQPSVLPPFLSYLPTNVCLITTFHHTASFKKANIVMCLVHLCILTAWHHA